MDDVDLKLIDNDLYLNKLMNDELSAIAVYSIPDLILLKANKTYLDSLKGYVDNLDNLIGKPINTFLQTWDGSCEQALWQKAIKTEQSVKIDDYAYNHYIKGQTYWNITITPIKLYDNVKYLIYCATEITEKVVSEKLFNAISNGLSNYISFIDKNGNYLKKGKIAVEDFPVVGNVYDYIKNGNTFYDFDDNIIPNDELIWFKVLRGQQIKNVNFKFIKEGKEKYVICTGIPIFSNNGELLMGIIISHDITEINKQSEMIKKQKKQLEAIIENITEELYIVDKDRNYVIINNSARENNKLMNTKTSSDFNNLYKYYDYDGNEINADNTVVSRSLRGEEVKDEIMIIQDKFNEIKRYISVNGKPIKDEKNNVIMSIVTSRNVTTDTLYKRAIERQLEMLNNMIECLDLPIIRLSNQDLNIIDVNNTAYNFFRAVNHYIKSKEDIIGDSYLNVIVEEDRNDTFNYLKNMICEKKVSFIKKSKWIISDEEMFVNILYQPIYKLDGQIQEIVCIIFDVTSEVKAAISLENTLKLQEEFFSNISHEFKTPLNVIYSSVQMLELMNNNDLDYNIKTALDRYIKMMRQNSFRLIRLVNNLIDISKIESGFFKLDMHNVDIIKIIKDITKSVTEFAYSKGICVIFDTDIKQKIIACDVDSIERIILNLLSNAIKFTYRGNKVIVSIKENNNKVSISVRDEGIGIPEDKLDLIFERFKQLDKTLSRKHEGSGIGLSIVKLLVELHQGKINVKSKVGIGSEFTIELPDRLLPYNVISLNTKTKCNKNVEKISIEFSDIYA